MTTYPVRVSPDGLDVAIRSRPATFDTDTAPWRSSDGSILSDNQVADWTPLVPASGAEEDTGPVGAAAAASFDAWQAAYPPRIGNDLDISKIPAMLAGLPANDLEILALSLDSLRDIAWDVRRDKLRTEVHREESVVNARVTLHRGHLAEFSTVTIGEAVGTVPTSLERTGALFAPRVVAVVDALGYRLVNGMKITAESDPMGREWIEYGVVRKAVEQ